MDYRAIYKRAYELMDEPIMDGNCGELCNYHCCRNVKENGEDMGIYLLPFEFEAMLEGTPFMEGIEIDKHSNKDYYICKDVEFLYYMICNLEKGCLREYRPIQCRTYPFEPYLESGKLYLIIEKDQDHKCPLLTTPEKWRSSFVRGIYYGWMELLQIPQIRAHIQYDTDRNRKGKNVLLKLGYEDIMTF